MFVAYYLLLQLNCKLKDRHLCVFCSLMYPKHLEQIWHIGGLTTCLLTVEKNKYLYGLNFMHLSFSFYWILWYMQLRFVCVTIHLTIELKYLEQNRHSINICWMSKWMIRVPQYYLIKGFENIFIAHLFIIYWVPLITEA